MNTIIALAIALTLSTAHGDNFIMDNNVNNGLFILDNGNVFQFIDTEDIKLMERCVMSEAGNQSVMAQEAVATVILNRWMNPEKYPDTIEGVITDPGQFSTHDNGEVTVSVRLAVYNAIVYYNTYQQDLPKSAYYFRADKYHDFGIPYCNYGDLYFSLASDAVTD